MGKLLFTEWKEKHLKNASDKKALFILSSQMSAMIKSWEQAMMWWDTESLTKLGTDKDDWFTVDELNP